MAVTGIGTYASYTNSYGNTQNAGNKTGRTYKNAHEYKNYLTQKYDCLRSRDYSVNINRSLLSEAMGDEKTKQWLEYNLSLIPESIEKLKAAQSARGCKVLSVTDTINGYDSITEEVLVTDEVDPGTEKARKELEERLEKRKAEKKETEERLEKQRAEKQDQEERQYNLKIDGKDAMSMMAATLCKETLKADCVIVNKSGMGHCQLDSALAFNWAEKMGMTCVMNLSAVSNDKPGDMLVISDPKIDAVINSGRNYDLHHPRVDRVIGEGTNVPSLMGIDVRGPFTHTTNFAYQGIWSQLGDCYVTTDSDLPEVPEKEA